MRLVAEAHNGLFTLALALAHPCAITCSTISPTLLTPSNFAQSADFIITQMFFDVAVFLQFVKDCREWGIECPVVPGLMCINAYAGFVKMTHFCKTRVPDEIRSALDKIQNDSAAIKNFGVELGVRMCNEIVAADVTPVLHFYTLNLEKVVYGVLDGMGWSKDLERPLLEQANEGDASLQVAKGSAWARPGDQVKTSKGQGTLVEILPNGDAMITLSDSAEAVQIPKGDYSKVF
jgi:Methylenetetrahydrofolate reductase